MSGTKVLKKLPTKTEKDALSDDLSFMLGTGRKKKAPKPRSRRARAGMGVLCITPVSRELVDVFGDKAFQYNDLITNYRSEKEQISSILPLESEIMDEILNAYDQYQLNNLCELMIETGVKLPKHARNALAHSYALDTTLDSSTGVAVMLKSTASAGNMYDCAKNLGLRVTNSSETSPLDLMSAVFSTLAALEKIRSMQLDLGTEEKRPVAKAVMGLLLRLGNIAKESNTLVPEGSMKTLAQTCRNSIAHRSDSIFMGDKLVYQGRRYQKNEFTPVHGDLLDKIKAVFVPGPVATAIESADSDEVKSEPVSTMPFASALDGGTKEFTLSLMMSDKGV